MAPQPRPRRPLPGGKLRRIEGAGHLLPVDEPAKLSAALLEGFGAAGSTGA